MNHACRYILPYMKWMDISCNEPPFHPFQKALVQKYKGYIYFSTFKKKKYTEKKILSRQKIFIIKAGYMGVFNAIITADPLRPSPTPPIPLTNFQESSLYTSVCSSKPYEGGLTNIPKKQIRISKRGIASSLPSGWYVAE